MNECSFYKVEKRFYQSKEIRADRQVAGSEAVIPYCTHKHSPAPQRIVTKALGGACILTCEGKLDKCLLSIEKLQDV